MLKQRAAELPPPIQMCDALSRNVPKGLAVILGNCLAHCRRHYVEVAANFAPECQYVLETLGAVYGYDEEAHRVGMSDIERLVHHQARSGPLMYELRQWGQQQLDEHRVEPNSGVGPGDRLYAQPLGEADTVSAASWSAAGFQHRGAGSKESDFAEKECAVL